MTRLDQATDARLRAIREEVRSGATEMTGKTKRDESGKIVARFSGGFSKMYPEVEHAGLTPARAAAAIERGKGKPYQRLRQETRRELSKHIREYKKRIERPTVPAHSRLTKKCKICGVAHGKGAHRFHGKGSFQSTHLFSFGGNPVRKKSGKKLVLIYGVVLRIEAQKAGPHRCDATCKRFQHKYQHTFKTKPKMYGLPNGDLLITSR